MSGHALGPAPLFDDCGGRAQAIWWRTPDGLRLRLMTARPEGPPQGLVALLPGRTEWIEKYAGVTAGLLARGFGVAVPDWRGQGLSDRAARNRPVGHVRSFGEYQTDLAALLAAGREALGALPLGFLSHSMGGTIALRALVEGVPARAAVFVGPMWGMPWTAAKRLTACVLLRIKLAALRPMGRETDYLPGTGPVWGPADLPFEATRLTGDRSVWERLGAQLRAHPELRVAGPSLGWFAAALSEMAALTRSHAPDVPALIITGSADDVVSDVAIVARLRGWSRARRLHLDGARHEVLMEIPPLRHAALEAACDLFDAALAGPTTAGAHPAG